MLLTSSQSLHIMSKSSSPILHQDTFDVESQTSSSTSDSSSPPLSNFYSDRSIPSSPSNVQYQGHPSYASAFSEKHHSHLSLSIPTSNPISFFESPISLRRKIFRRISLFTFTAAIFTTILFFYFIFSSEKDVQSIKNSTKAAGFGRSSAKFKDMVSSYGSKDSSDLPNSSTQETIMGAPIMGAMNNETIRAEVGRASWKLFHTILAKYSKSPTTHEREALSSYIHLFSRVYPCGQCASHFQDLLRKYPPQTSSREAAAQWGCFVHNQVNARLGKEAFDCNEISDKYSCGCADEALESEETEMSAGDNTQETGGAKKDQLADASKDTSSRKSKKSEKPAIELRERKVSAPVSTHSPIAHQGIDNIM